MLLLRSLRDKRGWTLEQVAQAAEMSVGFLSDIERGRSPLPAERWGRLAPLLALGEPQGETRPHFLVGILRMSGDLRYPLALARGDRVAEGALPRELPLFERYQDARAIVAALHGLEAAPKAGACAVPVWSRYANSEAARRDAELRPITPTDDPEAVGELLPSIIRGLHRDPEMQVKWLG